MNMMLMMMMVDSMQEIAPMPTASWLTPGVWKSACDVEECLLNFANITTELMATPCWVQLGDTKVGIVFCNRVDHACRAFAVILS